MPAGINMKHGSVICFDFLGKHEFHGPHRLFLKELLKRPNTKLKILIVVKATDTTDVIRQKITRWTSTLQSVFSEFKLKEKGSVIIVGSFADKLSKEDIEKKETVLKEVKNSSSVISECMLLDCRSTRSEEFRSFLNFIGLDPSSKPKQNLLKELDSGKRYNWHLILSLFHIEKSNPIAVKYSQFEEWIGIAKKGPSFPNYCPEESKSLCRHLSETGNILDLEDEDSQKHWLVFRLSTILDGIYKAIGKIRAGDLTLSSDDDDSFKFGVLLFKSFRRICSCVGLDIDEHLLLKILLYYDFCFQIELKGNKCDSTEVTSCKDKYLFFPVFITARPSENSYFLTQNKIWAFLNKIWRQLLDYPPYYQYYLCLQIKCKPTAFFSPELLLKIFLQIKSSDSIQVDEEDGKLKFRCDTWQNGISWYDSDNVRVVFQHFDNEIIQVIGRVSGERKDTNNTPPNVEKLVRCVFGIAKDIFVVIPKFDVIAYIVNSPDPSQLCYQPRSKHRLRYSVSTIINNKKMSKDSVQPLEDGKEPFPIRELFGGYLPTCEQIDPKCPKSPKS